jgi:2,4-dienoyl-CoA reductase-like NADH-dependent reductase (Old Yellow Enzyme family)/thioredoxin reductase
MTFTRLFEPIAIRGKVIRNRIVQPGQGTGFGHLDGRISRRHLDFHRAKALGGVGLVIFEHTGIDRRGNVIPLMEPLIDDDRFVPRLRELTEMVQGHGARIFFQLGHGGRRAVYSPLFYRLARIPGVERLAVEGPRHLPSLYVRLFAAAWRIAHQPKGPSAGPASWGFRKFGREFLHVARAKPAALTREEIRELVRLHGEAARRVKAIGGDGVEVYCCHGYLLSQFFSPVLNQRTDEYGGDVAGRARLTLEVIREVRRVAGDEMIIALRLNAADHVDGGSDVEAAKVVAALAEEAGADVINVTAGLYGSYPPMIPPMAGPRLVRRPRRGDQAHVRIPVIGGIRVVDPVHAESLLAAHRVDLVLMGRALLADPDLPNMSRNGRLDEIRKCIGCNQCLEITEGAEAGIHCLVNPQLGREGRLPIRSVRRKRKIAVVGGGPAGMKAAQVLAQRGHEVVLFEKNALGGRLRCMARVPGNGEAMVFLDALEAAIRRLGVTVRQQEVTEQDFADLGAAAVVVASGGQAAAPRWRGDGGIDRVGMDDVFAGRDIAGRIFVWGQDLYALSTALYLVDTGCAGRDVMVAEVPRFFPLDPMEVSASALYLRVMLAERGVEVVAGGSVERLEGRTVVLRGDRRFEDVTTIVTCALEKNRALEKRLRARGIPAHTIGDARWPRKSAAASCEAFELAARL